MMRETAVPAMRRTLGTIAVAALCIFPGLGAAQTTSQELDPSRCPRVADPHGSPHECHQVSFDAAAETITGDWNGARTTLHDAGITPKLSLYSMYFGNGNGTNDPIYGSTVNRRPRLTTPSLVRIARRFTRLAPPAGVEPATYRLGEGAAALSKT